MEFQCVAKSPFPDTMTVDEISELDDRDRLVIFSFYIIVCIYRARNKVLLKTSNFISWEGSVWSLLNPQVAIS